MSYLGTVTPIVSESPSIFLRSLIGRTATAFHTIGSNNNIEGAVLIIYFHDLLLFYIFYFLTYSLQYIDILTR
jgi:hypothetical protein